MISPSQAPGIGCIRRTLACGPTWHAASSAFLAPDSPNRRCLVLDSGVSLAHEQTRLAAGPQARAPHDAANLSYLADSPIDEFVIPAPISQSDAHAALGRLRDKLNAIRVAPPDAASARRFIAGWAGFLGYEFGAALEGVAPATNDDYALPAIRLALYDAVACYDHAVDEWEVTALLLDSEHATQHRLDEIEARLRSSSAAACEDARVFTSRQDWLTSARCNMTRADYEAAVARAKDYIAAGDIYQVNIAQRFTWDSSPLSIEGEGPGVRAPNPVELFAAIRRQHPADYGAFLAWPGPAGLPAALCSASPELFLAVRDRHVITRPIKGTRLRGQLRDRDAAASLLASEKDAAELAMIVDLERNDLGRVCRFGSIRVSQPRAVQTLPHVLHTCATVEGDLADGRDMIDLIAATFPGGSITGAPKIRAMQIIAEIEPTTRSAYTGSIGYFSADGSVMLSIAIRTAIVAAGRTHLHVGAGIVADSQPPAEYDETLAKAEGIAQAIAGLYSSEDILFSRDPKGSVFGESR